MPSDRIAAAPLDVAQNALEALVGERLDPAAVVADDVVVVLDRVADGLETRDPVPEVDALHEPLLREHVEHAVDACEADPLAPRDELSVNVLRTGAAILGLQECDHAPAGETAPVAGCA